MEKRSKVEAKKETDENENMHKSIAMKRASPECFLFYYYLNRYKRGK